MVHKAMKFTPQVLLSAPRRSAGVPNATGTKVLYTSSTYSFETHSKTTELRLLHADSGSAEVLAKDADVSDLNWLDGDEYCYLQGGRELCIGNAGSGKVYCAAKLDAPAGNLKVGKMGCGGKWVVVVSVSTDPQGEMFDPEKTKKTRATGRVYKELFVRHWDQWVGKETNSLWYGVMKRGNDASGKFGVKKWTNALKGMGLECPIQPFGGTDCFALVTDADGDGGRLAFVAKDPYVSPALNTKCNTYVVEFVDWNGEPASTFMVNVPGYEGAATCPCFNKDGSRMAFLKMKANGYEADRNDIFVLRMGYVGTMKNAEAKPIAAKMESGGRDDQAFARSPSSVCFSDDGETLLLVAEDVGASKLFSLRDTGSSWLVRPLTRNGSISDVHCLQGGKIFVSGSSITDNSFYAIVDPLIPDSRKVPLTTWTNSNSGSGSKFGLKTEQVSSIWTPASNAKVTKEVHSIVVRPSNFDSEKKYPVAYLIHGGPQSSWGDAWSTRWNPAIFAEQGYIVVAPNPTGSTGYGQAFTDAIRFNWGGDPYQDIVNVFEWVGEHMPEADNSRAVALGASYGGYMMNWIQGHSLGRKMKCIVCHDGITSFPGAMFSTEELYFPFHDLGGLPWYDPNAIKTSDSNSPIHPFQSAPKDSWTKWDPSNHFDQWATPQLVIHSSKDYRLPIAEGLAAFNVLQARGVESQLLTFPNENHWVLKPENSLLWHKVVLNWINKFSGLEAFSNDADDEELYGGVEEEMEEK